MQVLIWLNPPSEVGIDLFGGWLGRSVVLVIMVTFNHDAYLTALWPFGDAKCEDSQRPRHLLLHNSDIADTETSATFVPYVNVWGRGPTTVGICIICRNWPLATQNDIQNFDLTSEPSAPKTTALFWGAPAPPTPVPEGCRPRTQAKINMKYWPKGSCETISRTDLVCPTVSGPSL